MTLRFNPPPNWPAPPAGWTPPAGWQPDPSWGPVPEGWKLWVDDAAVAAASGVKQASWFARHKVLTGVAATAVVGIVAVGASGGGDDAADAASQSGAVASSTPSSGSSADDASAAADADDAGAAAKVAKEKAAKESAAKDKAAKEKAAKEKAAKEKAAKTPGLKDKVRDGKFEFTVTGVDCGAKKIGDEYINTKAQGEFCLVHMKVKNIGDEAQSFFADNQTAYNAKGQEFSADSGAAIYLADADSFMSEINPGNSIKGTVVFDVPKGTDLTSIDLHDSFFSGGVTVALR